MKRFLLAAALAAMAPAALAQDVPSPKAAGGTVLVITAEQIAKAAEGARAGYAAEKRANTTRALMAGDRYRLVLEHRVGPQSAALHDTNAELLFVIGGSGSAITGGTLVGAGTPSNGNTSGTGVANGNVQRVVAGDIIVVPQGAPHTFVPDEGQALVFLTSYLPRTGRFAPPANPGPNPPKTFHAASELPAMMDKARAAVASSPRFFGGDTILSLPPYRTGLEYRSPKGIASVHTLNAEIMRVLEGEGIIEAGGTLVGPRGAGANIDGDSIQGGTEYRLKKGDFIFVPSGVPHLARSEGTFVLATMHLPAD